VRSTLGRGTGFEASSGVERRLVKPQQFSAWNEILTSGKKRLVDAWQSHVGKDSSSFIQKAVFKNGHFPHAVLLIFPFKKINKLNLKSAQAGSRVTEAVLVDQTSWRSTGLL